LTFLINEHGKPFASEKALGNKFHDWCVRAGIPQGHNLPDGTRVKGYTAHGLRKASATFYADSGASEAELMAIFGFSWRMAALYTKAANQKRNSERAMRRALAKVITAKTGTGSV
jgi:hypothetical protein